MLICRCYAIRSYSHMVLCSLELRYSATIRNTLNQPFSQNKLSLIQTPVVHEEQLIVQFGAVERDPVWNIDGHRLRLHIVWALQSQDSCERLMICWWNAANTKSAMQLTATLSGNPVISLFANNLNIFSGDRLRASIFSPSGFDPATTRKMVSQNP